MSKRHLTPILAVLMCLSAASPVLAQAGGPSAKARADALMTVLKSEASLKDKSDACRELATLGDPRAVPVLAGLLADEKLSHMARYALEPIDDASVDAALRRALGTLTGLLRVGVISSIGMRRDAGAVDALTKLLAGPDKAAAAAAAGALGQIATDEAVSALAEFRKTAAASLRAVAADTSLAAAERLIEQGKSTEAAAVYKELQSSRWPDHVRLGAFSGLLAADRDKAPEMILRAIKGNDASLRAVAISRISTLTGRNVASRFAAELPKASPDVQVLLMAALVSIGDSVVKGAVVKAAGHDDAGVRAAALQALGALGDAECVPLLCHAVTAGKTEAETHAAQASLKALAGDGVDAAIIRCTKSTRVDARAGLIDVLIGRKAAGAVPVLLAQAGTGAAKPRATAFYALGKLAEPKDLPALLGLLVALDDETVRPDAERATVAVARKITNASAQADAVLAAYGAATATPPRCSLIRTLGGIGNAKALQAVTSALAEKDAAVQDAAVRALTGWPNAGALDALMGVFRSTDSPVHRILALRGCVRLLGLSGRSTDQKLKGYLELMAAAKRGEDKKLVLAGLATVASPAAAAAVEPYLTDPQVRPEAELATLGIARALLGSSAEQAKAVAEKLLATSKNRTIRRQATQIIRKAGPRR